MRRYFTIREKSTDALIAILGQDKLMTILKDTEHFYYTQLANFELMSFYRYCVKNNIDELCMLTIKNCRLFGVNIDKNYKLFQYKYELEELLKKNNKMHNENNNILLIFHIDYQRIL